MIDPGPNHLGPAELTAAVEHLRHQHVSDSAWISNLEETVDNHATGIDTIKMAHVQLRNDYKAMRESIMSVVKTVGENDTAFKNKMNDNDAALKQSVENTVKDHEEKIHHLRRDQARVREAARRSRRDEQRGGPGHIRGRSCPSHRADSVLARQTRGFVLEVRQPRDQRQPAHFPDGT